MWEIHIKKNSTEPCLSGVSTVEGDGIRSKLAEEGRVFTRHFISKCRCFVFINRRASRDAMPFSNR